MEIAFGVLALLIIIVFIGNRIGPPDPQKMTDAEILSRITSETSWLNRCDQLELNGGEVSSSLRAKYAEKDNYIKQLTKELNQRNANRTIASIGTAVQHELHPALERASQLVEQGMTEAEATATAMKEWHTRSK